MRRIAAVVLALVALLLMGSGVAAAQDQPDDPGPCDSLPALADEVCSGVSGVIGDGVGAVVEGGARAALSAVVGFVVDGAGWFLNSLTNLIDASTRPDVTAGWFQGAYQDMATIALLGILPFLLLAIIQGLVKQDPGMLLRSTFMYVPLAALGTGAAVVVVDMLVTITDWMSAWIGRSMGEDLAAFTTGLGTAVAALSAPTGGAVAGLAALFGAGVVAFATFVIWLELLLRQAAVYVAVLFLPLGFMAMVWPATAHWLRRLVQGLVAIILSKFVIVAVMALAATALDAQVADEGFAVVVSGAALLSLAALAPYVLLRLIPVFEAGMSSELEGTFRRPTAAVGAPQQAKGQISNLIRQRVSGDGSSAESAAVAADGLGSHGGLRLANTASAGDAAGGPTTAGSSGATSSGGASTAAGAAGGAALAGAGAVAAGAGAARRTGSRVGAEMDRLGSTSGNESGNGVSANGDRSPVHGSPPVPSVESRPPTTNEGDD